MVMTLTPETVRLDKRCGRSHIPDTAKCHNGKAAAVAAGAGALAVTAGAVALLSRKRGRSGRPGRQASPPSSAPRPAAGPPRLPGSNPRGLLKPAPPRKSKTQRMRENTGAAVRQAEQRIAQTAREEARRIAQIGVTMGMTGEATGMAAKTSLRELRLRAEAARRRFEPGYRSPDKPKPKPQSQLPESGVLPVEADPAFTVDPPAREAEPIPIDPRTGQPKRRRARGFGGS